MQLSKRVKSFLWRIGGFTAVAVCAYTANIGDIREIDFWKLATIFLTTVSAYVVNEVTKYLNSGTDTILEEDE